MKSRKKSNETTLITGASSGIGKELAHQFAMHGHPLILTAPIREELNELSAELESKYGVVAHLIAADLEREDAAQEIFQSVKEANLPVDILVNNAGLGQKGLFWEVPLERKLSMIRLNIEAVVRMTDLFLPPMVKRKRGRILNTASIAGFYPAPTFGTYHATKAFVLSFTEALATELEGTGVTATALCPGATDTDFMPKADLMETRQIQKGHMDAPQDVALAGYQAVMSGERVHVVGGLNKAMVFMRRFMPESMQAKIMESLYADVDPKEVKRQRGDIEKKASREKAAV